MTSQHSPLPTSVQSLTRTMIGAFNGLKHLKLSLENTHRILSALDTETHIKLKTNLEFSIHVQTHTENEDILFIQFILDVIHGKTDLTVDESALVRLIHALDDDTLDDMYYTKGRPDPILDQ